MAINEPAWRLAISKETEPLLTSVEGVRERLLSNVRVSPQLLTKTIRVTEKHLDAKKTIFIKSSGGLIEKEIEDTTAQLAAADQIYKMTGIYARERDERQANPTVAMEVDPKSGIVRIIIGDNLREKGGNHAARETESLPASLPEEEASQLDLFHTDEGSNSGPSEDLEPDVEIIKAPTAPSSMLDSRPADIPEAIWRVLNS